jgi:hypothetical protein
LTDIHTLVTYAGVWQDSAAQLDRTFIQVSDYYYTTTLSNTLNANADYHNTTTGTTGTTSTNTSSGTNTAICTPDTCFPDPNDPSSSWSSPGINAGFGHAYYAATTYQALWRCYLTSTARDRIATLVANATMIDTTTAATAASASITAGVGALDDVYDFYNRLFSDLWTARAYIFAGGFGISLLISLFYVFLMRVPLLLSCMVWGSIAVTICSFFAGGFYAWQLATEWDTAMPKTVPDNVIHATSVVAVVLWIVGVVLILLGCCLRKAIQLAIVCVKEAGRAVNSMTIILLVPVLQAVGLLAFMGVFCIYAVHLASLGDITTKEVPVLNTDIGVVEGPTILYRVFEFSDFICSPTRCACKSGSRLSLMGYLHPCTTPKYAAYTRGRYSKAPYESSSFNLSCPLW